MLTEEEQFFSLLQHGDTFFPSGAVSFSWGLEMLRDDNIITSISETNDFIENQLLERWAPFDRVVIAHTYDCKNNFDEVASIDNLVECMTIASELREGSKRLGNALLTTHSKLNNPVADKYLKKIVNNRAYGHLSIAQGIIWNSIQLSKNSALTLSAYSFCVSVLGAAIRLGITGHIDCQKSLTKYRGLIMEILKRPVLDLKDIHAFTPYADIASMRHEYAETRLFAN